VRMTYLLLKAGDSETCDCRRVIGGNPLAASDNFKTFL
jgi:hypothetical protein